MSSYSHSNGNSNSNSQSELLNGNKKCREEKPEAVASPEQGSKKKRKRKKKNKAKEEEPNEHPQPQVCPKPLVATPIPINPEPNINDEKGKGPNEAGAEHPLPELTTSNDTPKKKKWEKKKKNVVQSQGAQPKEPSNAEHPQPQSCSKLGSGGPAIPIDKGKRKQRNGRGRKGMRLDDHVENLRNLLLLRRTLNLAQNQPDTSIPLCPKSSSLIDQTIPMDPAPSICPEPSSPVGQTITVDTAKPVDTEQEMKKQNGKKGNSVLDGAGPNERNMELSETLIQTPICHTAAPPVGPIVPVDPPPVIPTAQAILTDQENKTSKKKRKRKRKSDFRSDGEKPNEHNMELTEALDETSICHTAAPPEGPTVPVDRSPVIPTAQAILTDPENKTSKKRRKRKRKRLSDFRSDGEKPNEHNMELTEALAETSICHAAAPPGDPTVPVDPHRAIPTARAIPTDLEHKTSKKKGRRKKKKSDLKSAGEEPNDHNGKPRKSALKSQGAESDQDDTDLAAEAQIRRSRRVTVPEGYYASSMICKSCLQRGHKFEQCPRLKCLSMDEEVCFFCGEIGHSLGKCSVSKAGGGRFAKCLLCFATGHFTYNCQRKWQSI